MSWGIIRLMLIDSRVVRKRIQNLNSICIYLPHRIGDLIALTPSLANLKLTYPKHSFIAIGEASSFEVLDANQVFDHYIFLPPKTMKWSSYWTFLRKLRRYQNSAGILCTDSLRSIFHLFLGGIRVRIGFKSSVNFLLTHSIEPVRNLPLVEKYASLTKNCGASIEYHRPFLLIDEKASFLCDAIFRKYAVSPGEMLIGLNPGSEYGETKQWPGEYFVELAHKIQGEYGPVRFVVFGGLGNEASTDYICDEIGSAAINLSKESLGFNNIKPFVSRLDLLITNDCGFRWYAAAMQKLTLVLLGSTDPGLNYCFAENSHTIRKKIDCAPRNHRICTSGFEGMRDLTPELVFEAIQRLRIEKTGLEKKVRQVSKVL